MGDLPVNRKVDFFQSQTWKKGQLKQEIQTPPSEDTTAAGNWSSAYNPQDLETYQKSLQGKPLKSYDPNGFFRELGLPDTIRSSGRGDVELLKAAEPLGIKPDPKYIPAPGWIAGPVQKGLLALGNVFPGAVSAIDNLIDSTVMKGMEKPDLQDPDPYGREEDIQKGPKSELSSQHRYAGLAANHQHAWAEGVHEGSPNTAMGPVGTFELAKGLGFTEEQAKRIAESNNAVDLDQTHYLQNGKPRITRAGSGGENGDLHWHFNRSPEGVEDTRITASKTHLERAVKFAREGYFEAAERELGIGLHSLQDMFAHGQITPFNHSLLGDFPDLVEANPVGMYDTAIATEAYLKKFAESLGVKAPASKVAAQGTSLTAPCPFTEQEKVEKWPSIQTLVKGTASEEEKMTLAKTLAGYPKELLDTLAQNNVTLFLGKPGSTALDAGFGADLNGDGKVTKGQWQDVNKDGVRQEFEVEDQLSDGRSWSEIKAAYSDENRVLFLAAGQNEEVLQHELRHALDDCLSRDPELSGAWETYRASLFDASRREGESAFDLDLDEYMAQ